MATKVTNIQWDTDGEDPFELGLPQEATLEGDVPGDEVADRLSDAHGWCVSGFQVLVTAISGRAGIGPLSS